MKLLKAHISAFGKFQNKEFVFSDGLNSYCEGNGFGKSTLATFILAMFYGMETVKRNSKDSLKERTHYLPFGGGDYGGSLTFEAAGKTYRIEKTFDSKSDTADVAKLFQGNQEIALPEKPLGEYFFGLDKESFRKSVMVDSTDIEVTSTNSIAGKLQNDVDDTDDLNNFDTAFAKLSEVAKRYKKTRGAGLLFDLEGKLSTCQAEIANLESINLTLPERYGKRKALSDEIALDEAKERLVLSRSGVKEKLRQKQGLEQEVLDAEAAYEATKEIHPKGIASEEELVSLERLEEAAKGGKLLLDASILSEMEAARLLSLSKAFEKGIPSEEELTEAESLFASLSQQSAPSRIDPDEEKNARLLAKFKSKEPSDEEIASYRKQLDEYRLLAQQERDAPKTITVEESTQSVVESHHAKPLVFGSFGLALVFVGVGVAMLFVQWVIAVVMFLLGAALAGVGFFLAFSKVKTPTTTVVSTEKENPALKEIEKKRTELSLNVESFLAPFGYRREAGVEMNFASFEKDYESYCALVKALKEQEEASSEDNARRQKAKQRLDDLLSPLGYQSNIESFRQMKKDIAEYGVLQNKKATFEKNRAAFEASEKARKEFYDGLAAKYDYPFASPKEVRDFRALLQGKENELSNAKSRLASFSEANPDLKQEEGEQLEPVEEIQNRLAAMRLELSALHSGIEEDEAKLDALAPLKEREAELLEKIEESKENHRIYAAAASFLESAKQTQNQKYVAPIKSAFDRYAGELSSALGAKISIDRELNVTFVENGKTHQERYLSSGESEIIMFSLRLALIDNMFPDEAPFLLLDDPFIHLDDEHMAKMKTLLPRLCASRQILYFCCSEAKSI